MPFKEYTDSQWLSIKQFLDRRKSQILRTIKTHGPLESYHVEYFIDLLDGLSEEGSEDIKNLLSGAAIRRFRRNKDLVRDYLEELKAEDRAPVAGVLADGAINRYIDVQAKFSLSRGTATAAANPSSIGRAQLRCDSSGETYFHQTVHGPEGVRATGSDPLTVSCFYREKGGKYYLVAWGVHVDKGRHPPAYRVEETVDDCGLEKGAYLFP